jgi:hypothetical protein
MLFPVIDGRGKVPIINMRFDCGNTMDIRSLALESMNTDASGFIIRRCEDTYLSEFPVTNMGPENEESCTLSSSWRVFPAPQNFYLSPTLC